MFGFTDQQKKELREIIRKEVEAAFTTFTTTTVKQEWVEPYPLDIIARPEASPKRGRYYDENPEA